MNDTNRKKEKKKKADRLSCWGQFLLLVGLLCMCCQTVGAQVKMAVAVSPQLNENFGVRAGMDFDISIGRSCAFVPGIYYSMRNRYTHKRTDSPQEGGGGLHTTYDFRDRAHLITVPLRLGISLAGKDESRFVVQLLAGPYVACGIGGTSREEKSVNGVKEPGREVGAFDAGGRYLSRWDYGLHTAMNARLHEHYFFGIFTEVGLRKIYRPTDAVDDFLGKLFLVNKINLALGLTLGYRF